MGIPHHFRQLIQSTHDHTRLSLTVPILLTHQISMQCLGVPETPASLVPSEGLCRTLPSSKFSRYNLPFLLFPSPHEKALETKEEKAILMKLLDLKHMKIEDVEKVDGGSGDMSSGLPCHRSAV